MSATGKDRIGTIPMMVRAAKEINFGISVTAYLCHVSFRGRCAVGIVFCDVFGRFEDGHGIHTSNIMSKVMVGSHTILRTVNSVYIVCSWSGEGLELVCVIGCTDNGNGDGNVVSERAGT